MATAVSHFGFVALLIPSNVPMSEPLLSVLYSQGMKSTETLHTWPNSMW